MKCLGCDVESDEVQPRPSMTAYHWNGEGENPNADVPLCDVCAEEHREYWRDMWDSYYAGCL